MKFCATLWSCYKLIGSAPETNFPVCAASQISPDTVLHLLLPENRGAQEGLRSYSTEELKELLNKLMLMSGKKDHSSSGEVEKFAEVSIWVCAAAPLGGSGLMLTQMLSLLSCGNVWVDTELCSDTQRVVLMALPDAWHHKPQSQRSI